jgi:hypothetical protein
VLVKHCYECHSAKSKKVKGDLLLDTREGARRGGEDGHAVVPGNIEESLIITALRHEDYEMPPKKKLPEPVVADFVKWIKMGAPDPRIRKGPALAKKGIDIDAGRKLWAFQTPKKSSPPMVKDTTWPKSKIDRYILARLESKKIKPVADADRQTLARRVYYDLTGLPPAPEELDAFLSDSSPDALAKLIDRLLDSPQFGERWARHWLDVVRYAESTGMERNYTYPYAWKYRDYVIKSFTDDKPWDVFLTQQLAGDLLPTKNDAQRRENVIATGVLALGIKMLNERDKEKFAREIVDDQIDLSTRAFMGITAACARCHNHKFDPIPQTDYYALAGIFRSTETLYGTSGGNGNRQTGQLFQLDAKKSPATVSKSKKTPNRPATNPRNVKVLAEQLKAKQTELQRLAKQAKKKRGSGKRAFSPADRKKLLALRTEVKKLQADFVAARKKRPAKGKKRGKQPPKQSGDLAMAVRERANPADVKFLTRGELDTPGDVVPRGFITVCSDENAPKITSGSGRLELARWMTDPANPLTARVAANRVWQHLFGYGIVRTVNNFGAMGTPPTHPELLDHLAVSLVEDDWSIKRLIRRVMLSRTYQLSAAPDATAYAADAENKLLWRMNRRRIEAESMRDTILAASGQLDRTPGKGSVVMKVGNGDVGRNLQSERFAATSRQRSVYLPILRGVVPEMLTAFDFPEPSNMAGQREETTVPTQALYMMNSPFVIAQAEQMARRLLDEKLTDPERVDRAYKLALARPATLAERDRTIAYIKQASGDSKNTAVAWAGFCQALFGSAEFRYLQ